MNKHRTIIIFSFLLLAITAFSFALVQNAGAVFEYEPMEGIPGFEDETRAKNPDLKVWIESTYKFFMWAVGICALFMITIGGFTYMTSAGNTSKAGTGKQIITDAIIGLILALVAVLLFTVINPNITSVNVQISPAETSTKTASTTTGKNGASSTDSGSDTCEIYSNTNNVIDYTTTERAMLPSACSMYSSDFQSASASTGVDVKILKSIAATESSCVTSAASSSSCGLMQIQPATAQKYNSSATSCSWLKNHPSESVMIAAQYISDNQSKHGGDMEKIFAGYNAGYGSSLNSDGTKPAFAESSDCPGALAYQCCKNPGGLEETQQYIFTATKYYNNLQ